MVDVGVRSGVTPQVRIRPEGPRHVLMDQELKVYTGLAIGSNDDVRTNALLDRHVATREGQRTVASIVVKRDANLFVGTAENLGDSRTLQLGRVRWRCCKRQKDDEGNHEPKNT